MKLRGRAAGMTLLELLVALAIVSLGVALLYRALGGAVHGTNRAVQAQEAANIANSLLDSYSVIDPAGVNKQGAEGQFTWRVSSQPYTSLNNNKPTNIKLHSLFIVISLPNGSVWNFETLRPQRPLQPGEVVP